MKTIEQIVNENGTLAQRKAEMIAQGFTYPRKKHSHRCKRCGGANYCYRAECTRPQRTDNCQYCR